MGQLKFYDVEIHLRIFLQPLKEDGETLEAVVTEEVQVDVDDAGGEAGARQRAMADACWEVSKRCAILEAQGFEVQFRRAATA